MTQLEPETPKARDVEEEFAQFLFLPGKQLLMQLERILADQAAVEKDIATYEQRVASLAPPANTAGALPQNREAEIDCHLCAERISARARVCRFCLYVQPSALREVAEFEFGLLAKVRGQR